jgi:hypothetical protein
VVLLVPGIGAYVAAIIPTVVATVFIGWSC